MTPSKVTDKKKLETKITELEAKLKRSLADYDNLEKRVVSQKEVFKKLVKAEVLDKFITVLDDLERAENHLQDNGLSLAAGQFRRVLESEGLVEIEAVGKVFDPQLMDCVEMVTGPTNRVIGIIQRGYQLEGLMVRPAKVKVGSGLVKKSKLSHSNH